MTAVTTDPQSREHPLPSGAGATNRIRTDPPGRVGWVDYAKGISIILVVFGHVLGGMGAAGILGRPLWRTYTNSFLYSFHSPTFFIVAGIFLGKSAAKPMNVLVKSKLRSLAYPYLLWSFLLIGIHQLFRGYANWAPDAEGSLATLLYRPYGHLWFIYVLLIGSLLFITLFKVFHHESVLIALSIALYLAVPTFQRLNWTLPGIVGWFFPYLTVGYLAGPWLLRTVPKLSLRLQSSVAVIGFTGLALLCAEFSYRSLWAAPLLALFGATGVIALSGLLASAGRLAAIRYVGAHSLPIYLSHVLGTAGARILLHKVLHIKLLPLIFVAGLAGGIGVPLVLARLAALIGFRYLFTFGVERYARRADIHECLIPVPAIGTEPLTATHNVTPV